MDKLRAECTILTFKLSKIRDHIERRLSVVEADVQAELNYILSMIGEYEHVPANWQLNRPLVKKESVTDDCKENK